MDFNESTWEFDISVAEIITLRWMCGTAVDRTRNDYLLGMIGVAPIAFKMRVNVLRQFGGYYK